MIPYQPLIPSNRFPYTSADYVYKKGQRENTLNNAHTNKKQSPDVYYLTKLNKIAIRRVASVGINLPS